MIAGRVRIDGSQTRPGRSLLAMPALIAALLLALVGALSFGAAGKRLRPRRSRTWFRILNRASARKGKDPAPSDPTPPA
jgi:hypothetical protein